MLSLNITQFLEVENTSMYEIYNMFKKKPYKLVRYIAVITMSWSSRAQELNHEDVSPSGLILNKHWKDKPLAMYTIYHSKT